MLRNYEKCKSKDLSSVRFLFTGAAPLGAETAEEAKSLFPDWMIGQGYGKKTHIGANISGFNSNFVALHQV